MEKLLSFIKAEFKGWNKLEIILFPIVIAVTIFASISLKDDKIALLSAICGITYTILAGKGKVSCFFFGLIGTLCYCWITYKNALYGNLALNLLFYIPLEIIGIFLWKKHLKKEKQEIIKTKLEPIQTVSYFLATAFIAAASILVLILANDSAPFTDAITTIFSLLGLSLTVKRCYEQWYAWLLVNCISIVMWIGAYSNGSNCFATIIMWITYLILGLYFMYTWSKELHSQDQTEE